MSARFWTTATESAESPLSLRAPGRAHALGGSSPLHARQGEVLAGRQGCPPRGGIRRKPQAKRYRDEQEPHTRHCDGDETASIVEVQSLSGRSWCRCGADERGGVCALPGETLFAAPEATAVERRREGEPGVSRGHSRRGGALKARRKNGAYRRSDR